MARRRQKRRTHLGAKNSTGANGSAPAAGMTAASTSNSSASRVPKSMVIRTGTGDVGPSVSQLVRDFRQMMEPHTASRLRERRSNRLRDYTVMAGPLGVSHLILFSRSESTGNVNLRLALTPRGPTMHFRVESYSLCKDVKKALRRPAGTTNEFTAPPLLVMNNFVTTKKDEAADGPVPKYLESLSTSVFQSLFPAISPAVTPLSSIQRVLLLNRDPPTTKDSPPYVLNLRHYAISTKRTGLPKAIRRLNAAEKVLTEGSNVKRKRRNQLPNLGKLADVSDYLLDPNSATTVGGFTSGSESEAETDAEVEMLQNQARRVVSRKKAASAAAAGEASAQNGGDGKAPRVEKRAIKLSELGPRLRLRLVKVEEGVCAGKIMWHEYVRKSRAEEKAQDEAWEEKRRLKEERKRVQRENVERKKKTQGKGGDDGADGGEDEDEDMYGDDWDSEDSGDDADAGDVKMQAQNDDEDDEGLDVEAGEVEDEWESEEEDEMEED